MGTGGLFLRKVRASAIAEPTGFAWVERGKLAASGYPASRRQIEWLVGKGITSILTLTPDPLPPSLVDGFGLTLGHIAMEDHAAPKVESLGKSADFVMRQLAADRTVLVHCLAGEGRTGCALASYLIKGEGVGPAEALKKLRMIKPEFVESQQEKSVFDFAASVKP